VDAAAAELVEVWRIFVSGGRKYAASGMSYRAKLGRQKTISKASG
jgi:hypothetical protein